MNSGPPTADRRPAQGTNSGTRTANLQHIDRAGDRTKSTTLNLAAGVAARDSGMQLAVDAADPDWRASVQDAVDMLVARGLAFTSEDVRELGVGEPDSPAAWGGVWRAACRAAGARVVGYRLASQPTAHARVLAVWVVAAA